MDDNCGPVTKTCTQLGLGYENGHNSQPTEEKGCLPRNLLVLPLPRFYRQTLLVHLMHIPCRLHIAPNILLKILNWSQRIRYVLILLNVADHFGGFGSFGEINQVGAFDQRRYAVFNKGQVGKVHPWGNVSECRRVGCRTYRRKECKEDSRNAAYLCIPQNSSSYS